MRDFNIRIWRDVLYRDTEILIDQFQVTSCLM